MIVCNKAVSILYLIIFFSKGKVLATCAAGYSQQSNAAGIVCTPCAAGTYSESGASTCSPCPQNTYSAVSISATCQPCQYGSTSLSGSSTCTCSANFLQQSSGAMLLCYPFPTSRPSWQPSSQPSSQPSLRPFSQPTGHPSRQPVLHPSSRPSSWPSRQPSQQPIGHPTTQPSRFPITRPTRRPSSQPFTQPSKQPAHKPSSQPSRQPSSQPSRQPTRRPSSQPSTRPSTQPTVKPSHVPSGQPSSRPISQPSRQPSSKPSSYPSMKPTKQPTNQPSRQPSLQPFRIPTRRPTGQPSMRPSAQPVLKPSHRPTSQPSGKPSWLPSSRPTSSPTTSHPTSIPTSSRPSSMPTNPTGQPSRQPSRQPTAQPSRTPTHPTSQPTSMPSYRPSVYSGPGFQQSVNAITITRATLVKIVGLTCGFLVVVTLSAGMWYDRHNVIKVCFCDNRSNEFHDLIDHSDVELGASSSKTKTKPQFTIKTKSGRYAASKDRASHMPETDSDDDEKERKDRKELSGSTKGKSQKKKNRKKNSIVPIGDGDEAGGIVGSHAGINISMPPPLSASSSAFKANALPAADAGKVQPNHSVVFVKPPFSGPGLSYLLSSSFEALGVRIQRTERYTGKQISELGIFDRQYSLLSEKAVGLHPEEYSLSRTELKTFEDAFQLPWEVAIRENLVLNAKDAKLLFEIDGNELNSWCEAAEQRVRVGKQFYVACVAIRKTSDHEDGLHPTYDEFLESILPKPKDATELQSNEETTVTGTDAKAGSERGKTGARLKTAAAASPTDKPPTSATGVPTALVETGGTTQSPEINPTSTLTDPIAPKDPETLEIDDGAIDAISIIDRPYMFIVNGFFDVMKADYTDPDTKVLCMAIEWNGFKSSWSSVVADVFGPRNPARAPRTTIRGMLRRDWQRFGLRSQPNAWNNCVHVSASALEGLAERLIWLRGTTLETEMLGSSLLFASVPAETIERWVFRNPFVLDRDYRLYEYMDGKSALDCIALAVDIMRVARESDDGGSDFAKSLSARMLATVQQQQRDDKDKDNNNGGRTEANDGAAEEPEAGPLSQSPKRAFRPLEVTARSSQTPLMESILRDKGIRQKVNSSRECALFFIKPHAFNEKVRDLICKTLADSNIEMHSWRRLGAYDPDFQKIFDRQYKTLVMKNEARNARDLSSWILTRAESKIFRDAFGQDWRICVGRGWVWSGAALCHVLKINGDELLGLWRKATLYARLSQGFHCALIDIRHHVKAGSSSLMPTEVYCVNGFFPSLEESFFAPYAEIECAVLEWDSVQLSWSDMQTKVIGSSIPAQAADKSIRRRIAVKWRTLGLDTAPHRMDNCVHVSASALEALGERINWVKGTMTYTDLFGARMLRSNIKSEAVNRALSNPVVGSTRLFDLVEGCGSEECIEKISRIVS